ncbi:MAG TPA: glycosyltransferase family 2 protein [Dehalococcoidia bacterium]|nr:glycosyltransferase family 2 protein [Dehalococcoidia bacterium]
MNLSVVLCTYNRAAELEETLTALAAQRVPAHIRWELVLVNNNSTDETEALCRRFAAAAPMPVLYLFEPEQGLSRARNTGVAAAGGSVIAFTDDDVSPPPDWVAKLFALMENRRLDGVGGRIVPIWPVPPPGWLDVHLRRRLALLESAEPRVARLDDDTRTSGIRIYGANMAFRREVFADVGLFITTLSAKGSKLYRGGDTEFVRRAVRAGKTIFYEPDLVVGHRIPPDRMTRRYFRKWAFDNGEGQAITRPPVRGRNVLGIPLYHFRAVAREASSWVSAVLRGDPDAFCRQLDFIDELGAAWGYVKKWRAERIT